jgi:hypothetical protein
VSKLRNTRYFQKTLPALTFPDTVFSWCRDWLGNQTALSLTPVCAWTQYLPSPNFSGFHLLIGQMPVVEDCWEDWVESFI